MYYFFGPAATLNSIAANQSKLTAADDMMAGNILFASNIAFSDAWCFNAAAASDYCEIIGSEGKINFSFFRSSNIELVTGSGSTHFTFEPLQHDLQPMIEKNSRVFFRRSR